MNIKRYKAADMRSAFKQIRAEHGEDVVMLSSRRIRDGVEVVVAIDQAIGTVMASPRVVPSAVSAASPAAREMSSPVKKPSNAEATPALPAETGKFLDPLKSVNSVEPGLDQEIRALRRLLETQLAALAWNDLSRRSPAMAEVSREFTEMGFSRELVNELLTDQASDLGLTELRSAARQSLQARLGTLDDRWMEEGGTIAVVGAAGSGKTTALASLAARWVMRNGTHSAALVSAVETRFGVRENLQRMGRLVGLPVFIADSWQEVPALLRHLADRRFVLVDTPTVSSRHSEFADYLLGLSAMSGEMQFAMAISAASQAGAIRESLQRYKSLTRMAAVITHLDECSSLGGLLSALIEHELPVAYTQSGARLLDDLLPARADSLLELTATLARDHGATADEELLSRRLEVTAHVA
jgi:flagellar biosynthesis protein FlhF